MTPRAADVGPPRVLHRVLEGGPIELPITKQHHLCPLGEELLHLLDHGDMEGFGKVPFLPVAHSPGERQGSAFVDDVEHEGDAPAPHDAAIDDEHPRLQGQMCQ